MTGPALDELTISDPDNRHCRPWCERHVFDIPESYVHTVTPTFVLPDAGPNNSTAPIVARVRHDEVWDGKAGRWLPFSHPVIEVDQVVYDPTDEAFTAGFSGYSTRMSASAARQLAVALVQLADQLDAAERGMEATDR